MKKRGKIKLQPPAEIRIGGKGPLSPAGCYLGWSRCTGTADVQVGDGWLCHNCNSDRQFGDLYNEAA